MDTEPVSASKEEPDVEREGGKLPKELKFPTGELVIGEAGASSDIECLSSRSGSLTEFAGIAGDKEGEEPTSEKPCVREKAEVGEKPSVPKASHNRVTPSEELSMYDEGGLEALRGVNNLILFTIG